MVDMDNLIPLIAIALFTGLIFGLFKVKSYFRKRKQRKFDQLPSEEKRKHKETSDESFRNTMMVVLPYVFFKVLKEEVGIQVAFIISFCFAVFVKFIFDWGKRKRLGGDSKAIYLGPGSYGNKREKFNPKRKLSKAVIKKVLLIILILSGIGAFLSVVYYFSIFLPEQQKKYEKKLIDISREVKKNKPMKVDTSEMESQLEEIEYFLQRQERDKRMQNDCESTGGEYGGSGVCIFN